VTTADNSQIGTRGSGWYGTVTAVGAAGQIDQIDGSTNFANGLKNAIIHGGSGYIEPYNNIFPSGGPVHGTETNLQVAVDPIAGTVVAVYPWYSYGYGYVATPTPDVINIGGDSPGSGGQFTVDSVAPTGISSNNTLSQAGCTQADLAAATAPIPNSTYPLYPSVARSVSANPPTDVIGAYWATLPYTYPGTIPAMLVGNSSANEQGYVNQLELQQKGNWDTNMTAHALLNWARPQFGLTNPY
jgi:hypothetical protein